jgi:hypothetical protein
MIHRILFTTIVAVHPRSRVSGRRSRTRARSPARTSWWGATRVTTSTFWSVRPAAIRSALAGTGTRHIPLPALRAPLPRVRLLHRRRQHYYRPLHHTAGVVPAQQVDHDPAATPRRFNAWTGSRSRHEVDQSQAGAEGRFRPTTRRRARSRVRGLPGAPRANGRGGPPGTASRSRSRGTSPHARERGNCPERGFSSAPFLFVRNITCGLRS